MTHASTKPLTFALGLVLVAATLVHASLTLAQPTPDATAAEPAPAPAPAPATEPAPAPAPVTEPAGGDAAGMPAPPPPTPPTFDEPPPSEPPPAVEPEPTYDYAPIEEPPPPPQEPNPFAKGTFSLSVLLGMGYSTTDTYLILGAGPGYFLIDGLKVDFMLEGWLIGDPTIGKLTPGLTYVFHFVPVLKPYLGGFYRYTMIEDPYDNVSSLGVRFGAYFVSSSRLFIGGGAAYEHYLDSTWDPVWYPEISIGFAF